MTATATKEISGCLGVIPAACIRGFTGAQVDYKMFIEHPSSNQHSSKISIGLDIKANELLYKYIIEVDSNPESFKNIIKLYNGKGVVASAYTQDPLPIDTNTITSRELIWSLADTLFVNLNGNREGQSSVYGLTQKEYDGTLKMLAVIRQAAANSHGAGAEKYLRKE
jgi:hypothetical protein